jgi:hypothetical protein
MDWKRLPPARAELETIHIMPVNTCPGTNEDGVPLGGVKKSSGDNRPNLLSRGDFYR